MQSIPPIAILHLLWIYHEVCLHIYTSRDPFLQGCADRSYHSNIQPKTLTILHVNYQHQPYSNAHEDL